MLWVRDQSWEMDSVDPRNCNERVSADHSQDTDASRAEQWERLACLHPTSLYEGGGMSRSRPRVGQPEGNQKCLQAVAEHPRDRRTENYAGVTWAEISFLPRPEAPQPFQHFLSIPSNLASEAENRDI